MLKKAAIITGVFALSALTGGVAFAQTSTVTTAPTTAVTTTPTPSGTMPAQAPSTGRAN